MFRCYHCGGCCEDVCTQINLTLGDIKRLCEHTKKTVLQLYKEGVIGIYPFGDPFRHDEFETDVGLFIPCRFRKFLSEKDKKTKTVKCSVYKARPLNCRLFPYWILADAPEKDIKNLICAGHECMKHFEIDEDFKKDRKTYIDYKEKLVAILHKETIISDEFYKNIGLKKLIKTKASKTKEDDLALINKLVKRLSKNDYSDIFKKIGREIKKHNLVSNSRMPKLITG